MLVPQPQPQHGHAYSLTPLTVHESTSCPPRTPTSVYPSGCIMAVSTWASPLLWAFSAGEGRSASSRSRSAASSASSRPPGKPTADSRLNRLVADSAARVSGSATSLLGKDLEREGVPCLESAGVEVPVPGLGLGLRSPATRTPRSGVLEREPCRLWLKGERCGPPTDRDVGEDIVIRWVRIFLWERRQGVAYRVVLAHSDKFWL